MAKQTIAALEKAEADYIVSGSASCVATLVDDYLHLFRNDPAWLKRAQALSGRVMDFTTFMDSVAKLPEGSLADGGEAVVTYHDSCQGLNALGLHEVTGSRISMASTAAGHAYTAALEPDAGDAFLAEMEREVPDDAKLLKPRLEGNRRFLKEHGYVVACGLWSPHINGLGVPLWSPQYQTFVVVTIGLLAAMYDEKRLHSEVAQPMRELAASVGSLLETAEGDPFNGRIERKQFTVPAPNKITRTEETNELEARTRRARSARPASPSRARPARPHRTSRIRH